jgi:hypothetical protein
MQAEMIISEVQQLSLLRFKLPPANLYLGTDATKAYTSGSLQFEHVTGTSIVKNSSINVNGVISSINSNYSALDGKGGTFDGSSSVTLDLTKYEAGTYVVRYSGTTLNEGNFSIKKNDDQTIIIYCTNSGTITINRYNLNGQQGNAYVADKDEDADSMLEKVIFYAPNATALSLGESFGTFIAPKASVTNQYTSAGVLVCNSVKGTGAEWHYHNHDLPAPGSTTLDLKKSYTNGTLSGSDFTFNLYDSNNKLIGTAKNDKDGKISFKLPEFTAVGKYTYTVKEVIPSGTTQDSSTGNYVSSDNSMIYDGGTITAVVTVTKNSSSNSLDAEVTSITKKNGKDVSVTSGTDTFTNEKVSKGSLKIVKATTGGTTPAGTTFTITGPSGFTAKTIKYSDFTNGSYLLENIPLGSYTVTEDTDSAKITSYTLNVTYTNSPATVTAGNTAEVDITNTYTQDKGKIKVTKTLSGGATGSYEFTFVVKTSAGKYVTFSSKSYSGTATDINDATKLKVNSGSSITLTDLPVGTYEVLEVSPEDVGILGWVFTTTGSTTDVNEIAVEKGKTATAALTNAYTPELTSISGVKTWDDQDNQDGVRPTSITVDLYKSTDSVTPVATKTVTKASDGTWSYSFTDLPKYENGKLIIYSVKEQSVDGYAATYKDGSYDITNTHTPGKVSVSGTKTWADNGDQDGIRPTSIEVTLYKTVGSTKTKVETKTVTASDNWSYSWDKLAEKENGKEIKYSVEETAITGYDTTYSGYDITNSHTPEKTSISGVKTWDDQDNQDGVRPTSIIVDLYKSTDSVTPVATKTVTEADGWKYTFDNLPTHEAGKAITYSVKEHAVDGYAATYKDGSYDITNTHTPGKVSVSGTKTWADNGDQDGIRPTSIKVTLYKTVGSTKTKVETKTVTASDNWSYSWDKLAEKENGKEIKYSVEETAITGYDTTYSGYDITNSHTPEKTSISGVKTWDDQDNQDGVRPTSIIVDLYKSTDSVTPVATKTVTEADGWKYTFDNLPTHEAGKAITYSVKEHAVDGYAATYKDGSYDITNTHIPGKVSVSGTKTWADNGDQDGIRPTSIKVTLYKTVDGTKTKVETKTVTASDNWSYSWDKLAEKENGKEIKYSVEETAITGYDTTYSGYDITNSHTPEKTSISGVKTWDDQDNQDGVRPTSITVDLYKSTDSVTPVATKTVTEADGWKYTFDNLPTHEAGKAITYSVKEHAVDGYAATYKDGSYDITNTHTPGKVSVSGTKTWADNGDQDGIRPTSIEVTLYKTVGSTKTKVETKTVTASDNWSYSWDKLAEKENGKEIKYSVEETAITGYDTTYSGYDITNSHTPEKTSISGAKTWDDQDNQDGVRPTSIIVDLYKSTDSVTPVATKTVTEADGWKYTFDNLPTHEAGKAITYSVKEHAVDGYAATYKDGSYDITNTHIPGKVSVSGTKTWADNGDQDGIRPTSIKVTLYKTVDGTKTKVETKTVTASDNWSYSWDKLAEKENGKEIKYSVEETAITGYDTTYSGYDITNSHTPEKTSISGAKTWDDQDNQDGVRPTSIIVDLYKSTDSVTPVATKTVTEADGWKYTFDNLPTHEAGKAITYSVKEHAVDGYAATYKDGSYDITNTHIPGKVSVSGTKTWADNGDQDGIRPTSIKVTLYKTVDGTKTKVETKTVTASDNWSYSWDKLAEKENGKEIKYSVEETAITGYDTTYSGYDITNSHTPEKTSISGAKTWVDNDDQDGARPSKITVNLLKNGTQYESQTVTAGNDGKWSYSFSELDKYEDGKEIKYTVSEADVPGYTGKVDGNNITNTHTPVTTDRTVTKTWADNDDNDGLRPGTVTMYLYSDGTYTGKSVELTSKDNWASKTITGLQKYKTGAVKQEIDYKWKEGDITGYSADYDYSTPGTCKVTNTHGDNVTSITVNKNWSDNGDQDGLRAKITEVTVHLLNNGKDTGKSAKLNSSNNWSASFTELPVKTKGVVNKYSVSEDEVEGYTPEYSGIVSGIITVTNKHTPDKTKRQVTKVWDDSNDQDGIRPGSVTVNLLADGKSTGKSVTLNAADNWTASFDDLDKYANGEEIVYTFTENAFSNSEKYKVAFTKDKDSDPTAWTVTNTHTPDLTEATVSKVWDDNNDNDKVRPGTVVMQLLADNVAVEGKTVTLTSDDNWASKTITGLPKYSGGNQIVYSWQETVPAGYSVTSYKKDATGTNAWTVTNKHDNKTTGISVAKVWSDAKNQDGIQPSSVKVYLYADGVKTDRSAILNADNGWAASFDDLPINKGGSKITYSVKEENVPDGYKVSYSDLDENNKITVTNTHTPAVVTKTIKKIWDDNNNQDGKQPESVTVHLMADGVDTTKSAVLDKTNGWHTEFRDLQKYSTNGKEIVYSFTEDKVDGYELKVTNNGDAYTATNTHKTEVTERSISKVWDDADNQDNIRPANVKINLIKTVDGKDTVFSSVTLSALNSWTAKFTDLPVYEGGKEITYSFAEAEVPDGYTVNITNDGNAYTATNTHKTETTETSIKKVWDDSNNNDKVRPDSVTMQLLADGKAVDGKTVTLNEDNSWSAKIDGLQKYNKGTEIVYSWQEVNVPDGYSASTSKDATGTNAWTVTNTHGDDLTSITVKKAWDDGNDIDSTRTSEVKVYLYKNGVKTTESRVLSGDNGWTATFDKLPVNENGNKIKYTVVEEQVPAGYAVSYSDLKDNAITVTNKHTPDVVSKTIKKAWDDNDNQDGIRPASVTVHLIADGVDTGKTAVLSVENGWSAKFEGLKKNSAKGTAIVYTFTEDAVTGYKLTSLTSTDGVYTATNTHVPEVTKLSITKAWDDADNQDNVRPASVRINLISTVGTTESTVQSVTLSAGNNWTYVFEDLPVYDNGTKIVYSFKEDAVEGYKLNLTNDGAAYTATNIHTPAVTEASVSKVWDDNNNNDNVRPASVTMQLMANGTAVTGKTVTLDATDNWSGKLDNLPKFSNGTLINYTWKEILTEEQQKNYTPSYSPDKLGTNSWTVTNKHDDKVTSITVNKSWDDDSNNDGFRTKSVTVYLLADGKRTGDKVELSGNNKWTAVFDKLPVNVNGKQVTYTVEEEQVKAYEAPVYSELDNGIITITNTHKPVVVNLKATKSFLGNQLAKINEVDLQLYADGAPVSGGLRQLVTAAAKDSEGYYHWGNNELDAEWNDLPKYKNGQEIKYTVVETNNNNSVYKVLYNGVESENGAEFDEDGSAKVTNCEWISLSGQKTWNDQGNTAARPSTIAVTLRQDGKAIQTKVVSAADNWSYTFDHMPKFDEGDGHQYAYTVEETDGNGNAVSGYNASYSADNLNIVNTIQTTSVSVNKVWNDNSNQDGRRPINIQVQLRVNGNNLGDPVVISGTGDTWSYTWNNLPVYYNGSKAVYTVYEVSNPGDYAITYDQNSNPKTITNSYTPGYTSKTVTKIWDDQNNADGTRPAAITVRLYADGNQVRTATLTALNGWVYTFTNLPVKSNGNTITYTISEDPVAGYTTVINGNVITNSHSPETPPQPPINPPETPPATPPVDVLGARRTKTGSSVLGARRAPKTGDNANVGVWAVLMGASAAIAAVWASLRKKLRGDD